MGNADDAIAAADKAIAQGGAADRLSLRLQKVAVLQRLGRWDDAVALCKKLLAEFDETGERLRIRYSLANSYWGAKKHAESEAELRAILDADADHAGACNDLGYHLAEQGRNLDEAERLVRRAISIDRVDRRRSGDPEADSPAYLDSLAWVLFRREKLEAARDLLTQAAAMPDGANDGVVWDHLGDVQYRLGEKDKARAAWLEAEQRLPPITAANVTDAWTT
ncbi:MAG: tetratricopeptide repeat protein [Gemmataceae bacterium]